MLNDQEPDWMHGGHILRCMRLKIGLTQEQVCEMMSWSIRTYRNWEARKTEPCFGAVIVACECVFKVDPLVAISVAKETEVEY